MYFLGLNFALTCLDLSIGFLTLHKYFDIDITDTSGCGIPKGGNCRLALERATYCWLATVPLYLVSWLCLWYFYNCEHSWKKNNIVVGWQYDNKAQGIWDQKFKGFWVSECS